MNSDESRSSAYAELVVGLIDARERVAEERFDAELTAAEDAGLVDPQTARTLRWWQRESVRALLTHAELVFPPTMLALDAAAQELRDRVVDPNPTVAATQTAPAEPETVDQDYDPDPIEDFSAAHLAAVSGEVPPRPTDLTARRLLVAGLTPLRDP